MLCIALLAFVMIEEASPAHAAADLAQAAITYDVVNGADQIQSSSDTIQPSSDQNQYPDGPFQPAHHCCAAHTGGVTPAVHNAAVLMQPSVRVSVPLSVDAALSHAPEGLERPPKATAIV